MFEILWDFGKPEMRRIFWSTLAVFTLAACTPGEPLSLEEGIVISAPMVRAPLGGQTTSSGYFVITNHTEMNDIILGVASNDAERVEMHLTEENNGMMRMRKQDTINISTGETISFEPGGYHLMLFGMNIAQDQKDIQLNLNFKHAPDISIIAEIVETVPLSESHSGHH